LKDFGIISRKRCQRFREAVVVVAALASLSACSPYVFSDNVQTFSSKMGSIDSSYQDEAHKIVAERHLSDRTQWIHNRPVLVSGAGCDADAPNSVRCDLVAKGAVVPTVKPVDIAAKPQPIVPAVDICEPTAGPIPSPTKGQDMVMRKINVILPVVATEGDWEEMPWLSGQGIGLIHDIPSAADAVERMMAEAGDILGRLARAIRR
jgi:hypothetical protein